MPEDCNLCSVPNAERSITVVTGRFESDPERDVYHESEVTVSVMFPVPDKVTDAFLCTECYEAEAFLKSV